MTEPSESHRGGIRAFFLTLFGLAVLRVLLGYLAVPLPLIPFAKVLVGAIFLGAPIMALFFAARARWTPALATAFVVGGLALHFGPAVVAGSISPGPLAGILGAVAQAGLPIWCAGLGALIATLVKEKNILIPIAIFLVIFDAFLVLTDVGITQQILQKAPKVFESVALSIPSVQTAPTAGQVRPAAYAGPADFVFLAMFFIALFRFRMRTAETLRAVVPVLLAYLLLVVLVGVPLPALVPIGLTVLVVNRREFRLTRDEWAATGLVAVLGAGLLIWGMTRPRPTPPPEPAPTATGPVNPAPPGSPAPAGPGPRGSRSRFAPEGTPDPR